MAHFLEDRNSCFERSDNFTARGTQTVAANFDYVFIMASLNHDFNVNRLQRYLTAAWQSGGIPVIVLTKADLVDNCNDQIREVQKIAIGVEVMAVNDIREDDSRGRHTTIHRQLVMLKTGVMIIDTPGMRGIGMWDVSEGLREAFSDIEELFSMCKFSDCTHKSEPGCAVLSAIECGTLEKLRWDNYLKLKREARFTGDKVEYLREKQQWHKSIQKNLKNNKKFGTKL